MEYEYRTFTEVLPLAGDAGLVRARLAASAFKTYMDETFLPTLKRAAGGWEIVSHNVAINGEAVLITVLTRHDETP